MKLYYTPGACSLAVHIALRETGADFELVRVDLATQRLEDGTSFAGINPRGYVPVLELADGTRHTEASALLQHVADGAPQAGLLPATGMARLETLRWLNFVATELHPRFGWLWRPDTAEATRKACMEKVARRLAEMDEVLRGSDHLAAGRFTIADIYAFVVAGWAPRVGMGLADYPRLGACLARTAARPAVQAALRAEGLLAA